MARYLHLDPGAFVSVQACTAIRAATSVTVQPASPDDWEVLQLNADGIEGALLAQTGVVAVNQPIVVWVNQQPIPLKVKRISPSIASAPARLVDGTEIIIEPASKPKETGAGSGGERSERQEVEVEVKTALRVLDDTLARELDGSTTSSMTNSLQSALPYNVSLAFASPPTLTRCQLQAGDWVSLTAPRGGTTIVCVVPSTSVPLGHVSLSDVGRAAMGAEVKDVVGVRRLKALEKEVVREKAARNQGPGSGYMPSSLISEAHRQGVARESNTIRIPSSQRKAAEAILASVLPIVASTPRSILQAWGAPRPGSVMVAGPAGSGKTFLMRTLCHALAAHPDILASIHVVPCREVGDQDAEKVIAQAVARSMTQPPSVIVLEDLDALCPGAPEGEVHPGEEKIDHNGGYAVLFCEILDGIWASSEKFSGGSGSSNGHTLDDSMVHAWPPVAVIATCRDPSGLAPTLREVGRLETVVEVAPPTLDSRAEMLSIGLNERGITTAASGGGGAVDTHHLVRSIAASADGFDGADLEVLLDRAMNIATRKYLSSSSSSTTTTASKMTNHGSGSSTTQVDASSLVLTENDLKEAMQGFIPAAYWGSGTRTVVHASVQGWEDVGGMSPVRDALQESLELPLKYPRLVAGAPLRLRSGALLYGPPGCGKTHVVAAAVAATGVRCITVSGPELLNKYIGASEAAVRDVFRRAAAAAPSVLFFDEFDAIAPQRGHDNTGVTDRVVNQLLTELDGVEGLRGVCVVAATSRPDLIDAALLRPGRLDRLLYCGFPTEQERRDILEALSRRLALGEDVDFEGIAGKAIGLSGADLGALLSEAQLAAAHEVLASLQHEQEGGGKEEEGKKRHAGAAVVVHQRHIEEALRTARPSVSSNERTRLEMIYEQFTEGGAAGGGGGGEDEFDAHTESVAAMAAHIGKKVTWA